MNIAVLFDKSVFQSTPVSAFVAADRYLEIIIPPILVREIGGDLAASSGRRRQLNQRQFVEKLAARAEQRAFLPHHAPMIHEDLLGSHVPLDGRKPAQMRPVQTEDGWTGLVVVETPEEKALNRWRQGDFSDHDRLWAERWQRIRGGSPINTYRRKLARQQIQIEQTRTIDDLSNLIDAVFSNPSAAVQGILLNLIFCDFSVPLQFQAWAIQRFQSTSSRRSITEFAPYAAFCLRANLLLAFSSDFRRPDAHDLRDLEYLYYLPFCEVFASNDQLHQMIVPKLIRPNQSFVGLELEQDLRRLSLDWKQLSETEKIEFASTNMNVPPIRDDSIVRSLWEKHRPRNHAREEPPPAAIDPFFKKLVRQRYGSEEILEAADVNKASFLTVKMKMTKARAKELYPGFNFDESS